MPLSNQNPEHCIRYTHQHHQATPPCFYCTYSPILIWYITIELKYLLSLSLSFQLPCIILSLYFSLFCFLMSIHHLSYENEPKVRVYIGCCLVWYWKFKKLHLGLLCYFIITVPLGHILVPRIVFQFNFPKLLKISFFFFLVLFFLGWISAIFFLFSFESAN